jgi:hypothetical protein
VLRYASRAPGGAPGGAPPFGGVSSKRRAASIFRKRAPRRSGRSTRAP